MRAPAPFCGPGLLHEALIVVANHSGGPNSVASPHYITHTTPDCLWCSGAVCCLQEAHTGTSAGSLAGLQQLNASKLGIRSLGTVFAASGQLTRLTSVVLDNNHISSLGPLATLTRLVSLSLNSNRLGEAPPGSIAFAEPAAATSASDASTAGAPGNTSVVAGTTGNTTGRAQGQPVPLLPSLQVLHLAGNSLSSLVPLQLRACSGLRSLFVQGNELGLLEGLEGLVHLRELVADNNKLRWVPTAFCRASVYNQCGLCPVMHLLMLSACVQQEGSENATRMSCKHAIMTRLNHMPCTCCEKQCGICGAYTAQQTRAAHPSTTPAGCLNQLPCPAWCG